MEKYLAPVSWWKKSKYEKKLQAIKDHRYEATKEKDERMNYDIIDAKY